MKQFFTLILIAGVLTVGAPGQARMVSTKSQCVAVCSSAINDTCGWISKPGKFNRCRNRLIVHCRKWGTDVMCPTPPPPSAPPTTPTTLAPVVTTTTTVPYIPPTTTTLPPPPVDPLGQFMGTTWDFVYTLVSTWDDVYALGFTFSYDSSGIRVLNGVDQYGGWAGLALTDGSIPYDYLLVAPGSSLCEAFAFDITGPTRVDGVVFFFYSDCQTSMGGPYPFVGTMR
jgi:hypothetical protein